MAISNHNSILYHVYNYYQMSYANKSSSRFDAHKRSDLKNLYNSIVNQSKEEPVYLLRHSQDIEKYTIDMKESAMEFYRNITSYGGFNADELFEKKTLYSSNEDLATADYINNTSSEEEIIPASIYIKNLSQKQINRGYHLNPDMMNLNPGLYSFDVTTDSSSYELQFSINENDNNKSVQSRLARLINNSGIGLSASISTDLEGKTSLAISSTSTGTDKNSGELFTISDDDTSQKKGIVDYLGIRNPSQNAAWATYSIDGVEYSSPDNKIYVNGQYQVTLKGVSKDETDVVNIGTKPDYDSLKDSIKGVAGSYNKFIETVSKYLDKQPRTSLLLDNMKRMASHYQSALADFGITINDNSSLDVDDTTMTKALSGNVNTDSINTIKDFTKSALRKVNRIQLNPMDYVDKRIVAYKDPSKQHFANPYLTSAYSGMLFNGYM